MSSDYVLELPNELDAIDRAVAFLLERGEEAGFERERLRLNLRVGLTEALVNAVLYGNEKSPDKRVRVDASFDDEKASVLMRKYACCYAQGRRGAREFRSRVVHVSSPQEFRAVVDEYFPR